MTAKEARERWAIFLIGIITGIYVGGVLMVVLASQH